MKFDALTVDSKALFVKMICQADYDSEDNNIGEALMEFTQAEKGNLSDLKKKGMVETCEEGQGAHWVIFNDLESATFVQKLLGKG